MGHELSASAKEEFPKSALYHKGKYSRSEPPFPQMMRDLLGDAVRMTRDVDLSVARYVGPAVIVPVHQISRLLRSLCEATNGMHLDRKPQAERLNRRLAKVYQYYRGINSLTKQGRRYFPHGINHHWIDAILAPVR